MMTKSCMINALMRSCACDGMGRSKQPVCVLIEIATFVKVSSLRSFECLYNWSIDLIQEEEMLLWLPITK